jgi:starch-binding outer membrane protein, SusD/RagB family
MMKRIKYFLITITLTGCLMFLYSCSEDFLDKQPPGVAAGSVIQTEKGVESLLIGAYNVLRGKEMWGGGDLATEWQYGSVASDDAYKGTTFDDNVAFNAIERFETIATNAYLANRWKDSYNGVARSNDVLEFLWNTQGGATPILEPRASQIEAEAKFLRAWFHIRATKVFRYIPYIKTYREMDGVLPEDVPNESEGWEYIEEDLKYAIANLPSSKPLGEVGRACSWSAKAVLAHVYLYQNKFDLARPILDDIINNGPFELVDNYNDNYIATRNNNEESIFEIQSSVTSETSGSYLLNNRVIFHRLGPASFGWGFFQPSQDLFEAYQTKDGLPVLNKK